MTPNSPLSLTDHVCKWHALSGNQAPHSMSSELQLRIPSIDGDHIVWKKISKSAEKLVDVLLTSQSQHNEVAIPPNFPDICEAVRETVTVLMLRVSVLE